MRKKAFIYNVSDKFCVKDFPRKKPNYSFYSRVYKHNEDLLVT